MAIIRNSASALRKGRVGNTTYYVSGQRQIARVSQNSSNYGETARRTEAMQERRARWGNLVNFYKASKHWMKYAYETKTAKQSDYNRFMQINLNSSLVYLTKDQAALGACVVEPFSVSQGSLRSININKVSSYYETDITIGSLTIDDDTTVGSFSSQVIGLNNGIRAGFQLSFISYQQWSDFGGTPQITCTAYEVTLDPTSEAKLRDYLPEFCSTTRGTKLGTSLAISQGAFTYMWSVTEGGVTRVSSQTLINNNSGMISSFASAAQRQKAIESYGLDTDAFLMSGSAAQIPTPATQSILSIYSPMTDRVYPGDVVDKQIADFNSRYVSIYMERYSGDSTLQAYLLTTGGTGLAITAEWSQDRQYIYAQCGTQTLQAPFTGIRVVIDGIIYEMAVSPASTQNED